MTQIQPTTNATAIFGNAPTASSGTSSTTPALPGGALDQNAFLKLMMVQMKSQNPLNPADPTQYLSELAQFTTLEQETNIAQTTAKAAAEQNTVASLSLLGHTVSYTDSNGKTLSGLVQKVDFTPKGPMLTVNGVTGISPASVNQVS